MPVCLYNGDAQGLCRSCGDNCRGASHCPAHAVLRAWRADSRSLTLSGNSGPQTRLPGSCGSVSPMAIAGSLYHITNCLGGTSWSIRRGETICTRSATLGGTSATTCDASDRAVPRSGTASRRLDHPPAAPVQNCCFRCSPIVMNAQACC